MTAALIKYFSENNPFSAAKEGGPSSIADQSSGLAFNEGGFVSGQSGIDKIPAMLTDGEFVMSRGAVQQFGLDTLLAMNAAGGGTNRPRVVSGVSFAQGGGPIGDSMGPSDPTGLTMMRLLGLGSRQGLQGTRGFGIWDLEERLNLDIMEHHKQQAEAFVKGDFSQDLEEIHLEQQMYSLPQLQI